jgi:sec-independent protein translocase protein TatA
MLGLGHLPEILALLLVGLLVFGPKRVIEMGSSFGKAFKEFRDATREMSWSNLLSTSDEPRQTPLSRMSQLSQSFGASRASDSVESETRAAPSGPIVDGSVERADEPANNSTN